MFLRQVELKISSVGGKYACVVVIVVGGRVEAIVFYAYGKPNRLVYLGDLQPYLDLLQVHLYADPAALADCKSRSQKRRCSTVVR